jgi:hypothetical protein
VTWLDRFRDWLFRKRADSQQSNKPVDFHAHSVEQLGWRQGSLLPIDLVDSLVSQNSLPAASKPGHWIVVTQDCDLIHHDLAAEPFAEVVFAEIVEKPDSGYTWSKNARELHLHDSDLRLSLAFRTRWRRSIPREWLSQFKPSLPAISKQSTRLVARWISRKYF